MTLLPNDSGHLTYGRSQTTLASGNLYLLLKSYCENGASLYGTRFRKYLPALAGIDLDLDRDMGLRDLLTQAGDDPVMQVEQDEFFERVYWNPAVKWAETGGIISPLGTAVVYDSIIHGSWGRIQKKEPTPPTATLLRLVNVDGYPGMLKNAATGLPHTQTLCCERPSIG